MSCRIYLASSWRNADQPRIVQLLRKAGHEVYDFRNPSSGGPPGVPNSGFAWDEIDSDWRDWTPAAYRDALSHPLAVRHFTVDFGAMQWSNACVLLLPSGPSAAIEAGWCKGSGRRLVVHVCGLREADLMYAMADAVTIDDEELLRALKPEGEVQPLSFRASALTGEGLRVLEPTGESQLLSIEEQALARFSAEDLALADAALRALAARKGEDPEEWARRLSKELVRIHIEEETHEKVEGEKRLRWPNGECIACAQVDCRCEKEKPETSKGSCCVCGSSTGLACSDCGIESGGTVTTWVCVATECRDTHDRQRHPACSACGGKGYEEHFAPAGRIGYWRGSCFLCKGTGKRPVLLDLLDDEKKQSGKRYLPSERRWTACHSDDDGFCDHAECPQLRDGEPKRTGRHCPLDTPEDEEK